MESKKLGRLLPHQRPLGKVLPPKKEKGPPTRKVSVQQLSIMLYHFYIGITDPEVYYDDADESAEEFYMKLSQEVEIETETLEKLLWYLTVCFETGRYWNPSGMEYEKFVRTLLEQHESYDQLLSIIVERAKRKKTAGLV